MQDCGCAPYSLITNVPQLQGDLVTVKSEWWFHLLMPDYYFAVLTEEQNETLQMLVDPVSKFFEVCVLFNQL